jgi:hypothetical protein
VKAFDTAIQFIGICIALAFVMWWFGFYDLPIAIAKISSSADASICERV